jgi:apolipoprotein N-acyltransferase
MGFWPLAFAGLVLVDRAIDGCASARQRFLLGWAAGLAFLAPTTWWMHDLTLPGWVVASLVLSALLGLVFVAVPPEAPARWVALPGAWVGFEAIRGRWPFGGVPLSNLSMGQVAGPLAGVARVGASLLLGGVTVVVAVALSAALARRWRVVAAAVAVVGVAVGVAAVAPSGSGTGETLDVALVQGGGEQGTRAVDTDPRVVFERHLEASEQVRPGMDLVLWPEDVVDVDGFVIDRVEGEELAALNDRLGGVLVVGIIEQSGNRFTNEAVAFAGGQVVDRVGKERRVPFGEYVPFRSIIEQFSDDASARDAIVGEGEAVLETPAGSFGAVISWEVFFPDRARDAIGNGGTLLLNPTNGSSFSGTQVQAQQVASSRLRAIETGRWVLQAAPTGFSAIVTPDGEVVERTGVSERAVVHGTVELRTGRTWAVVVGDWLPLGLALACLVLCRIDRTSSGGSDKERLITPRRGPSPGRR